MKKAISLLLVAAIAIGLSISMVMPAQASHYLTMDGTIGTIDDNYSTHAVIDENGALWMWGLVDDNISDMALPYKVDSEIKYRHIQTTPYYIMDNVAFIDLNWGISGLIKTDGSLWLWGDDSEYYYYRDKSKPLHEVSILHAEKFMDDVIAYQNSLHLFALKNDGTLWGWGYNRDNYFGYGLGQYVYEPIKMAENVAAFYTGTDSFLCLKRDGSLWGKNVTSRIEEYGAGDLTHVDDNVQGFSGNGRDYCYIKNDGTVYLYSGILNLKREERFQLVEIDNARYMWGDNFLIKNDGTVWSWGNAGGRNEKLGYKDVDSVYKYEANGYSIDIYYQSVPKQIVGLKVALPMTAEEKAFNIRTTGFSDVLMSAYYADAVKWAVENNITNGIGNNQFGPGTTVTRGQAVTFLWRAMGMPAPSAGAATFTDVKADSYYANAVRWAVEKGITNGTGNGTFSPDSPVTRGQMTTFLYRTVGEPDKTGSGAWYEDAVNWATANNLLSGTAEAFSVDGACPRSDVIEYMYRELAD